MLSLKQIWIDLAEKYSDDIGKVEIFWNEIEHSYSNNRYYHNLAHLSKMIGELSNCKEHLHRYDLLLFATFYHDIIYNAQEKDNELKSAELCKIRLKEFGLDSEEIQCCYDMIMATKLHEPSQNNDARYFLDADMSILGSELNEYKQYAANVRKEYTVFSDAEYKIGRKKALLRFQKMSAIFQTEYFKNKFEQQARLNIYWELTTL